MTIYGHWLWVAASDVRPLISMGLNNELDQAEEYLIRSLNQSAPKRRQVRSKREFRTPHGSYIADLSIRSLADFKSSSLE